MKRILFLLLAIEAVIYEAIAFIKNFGKVTNLHFADTGDPSKFSINSFVLFFKGQSFFVGRCAAVMLFMTIMYSTGYAAQLDSIGQIDFSTPEGLVGGAEILYGAIVVLGGYLSSFIPGLKSISNATYRVLTFALIVGVGFAMFGSNILSLALSYGASTSIYETILKLVFKTQKPEPDA